MLTDIEFYNSPTQNTILTIPPGILGTPQDILFNGNNSEIEYKFTLTQVVGTDCYAF